MIQIHAVMSEWERDQISARTKAALAAAKVRGVKLGTTGPVNLKQNIEDRRAAANIFAGKLSGVIQGFKGAGLSQRAMVVELNTLGIKTFKGGQWSLNQVQRVMKRIEEYLIDTRLANSFAGCVHQSTELKTGKSQGRAIHKCSGNFFLLVFALRPISYDGMFCVICFRRGRYKQTIGNYGLSAYVGSGNCCIWLTDRIPYLPDPCLRYVVYPTNRRFQLV